MTVHVSGIDHGDFYFLLRTEYWIIMTKARYVGYNMDIDCSYTDVNIEINVG